MEMSCGMPVSVAKMQAKAGQLAEELRMARAHGSGNPAPTRTLATTMVPAASEPAGICANCTAACPTPQQTATMPSTTPVFRRLSQANAFSANNTAAPLHTQQRAAVQCQKLEAEVQMWKCKHVEAVQELERRQDSYMRREERLKAQLAAVIELHDTTGGQGGGGDTVNSSNDSSAGAANVSPAAEADSKAQKLLPKPATLQEMQEQVLHGLDDLLQRQRLQMRTEAAQQLKQFRSRLAEIEGQLQACKQAAAEHQGDWRENTLSLREELARTQEIASKLDAMFKLAEEEAAQLRVRFRAQEDDRQHLVSQLISVKRENSRLKQQQTTLQEELDAIMALALEAEANEAAPPQAGSMSTNMWSEATQSSTACEIRRSSNSLAAAINEVVSRRGSSIASGAAQGGWVLSRPATAEPGQQQPKAAKQLAVVRPWSAVPLRQRESLILGTNVADTPVDSTAVAAKQEHAGHVIRKLQKLLESERRQLRQLRRQYAAELDRRNELQSLLLDTVQQAKQQYRAAESAYLAQQRPEAKRLLWLVSERRPSSAAMTAGSATGAEAASPGCGSKPSGFTRPSSAATTPWQGRNRLLDQAAWEHLLNELLIKREVLELLFGQAFPDFMTYESEGVSRQQQQPSGQLQQITCSHMRQLWASKLLQQQPAADVQETIGLGRPSAAGTTHNGVLLDEVLIGSDSEDAEPQRSSSMQAEDGQVDTSSALLQQQLFDEQLVTFEQKNPANTANGMEACSSNDSQGGLAGTSMVGQAAGQETCHSADDKHPPASSDHKQQHQQLYKQQPRSGCLASADISVGPPSGPLMPSFPARQPLRHTAIRRDWSGTVQHSPHAAGDKRRPVSAAASGNAAPGLGRNVRAISAAGNLPGSAEQLQGQVALAGQQLAGMAATGYKRPGSRGSSITPGMSGSKAAQQTAGNLLSARPDRSASATQWGRDAANIAGSFLSTH